MNDVLFFDDVQSGPGNTASKAANPLDTSREPGNMGTGNTVTEPFIDESIHARITAS